AVLLRSRRRGDRRSHPAAVKSPWHPRRSNEPIANNEWQEAVPLLAIPAGYASDMWEGNMNVKTSPQDRLGAIEDRLEIYNLIASHPPSADTTGKDHITASWVEDGVFDRGENLSSPRGRDSIANQVLSADHQAAIERGLAHFTSLPHVAIEGD